MKRTKPRDMRRYEPPTGGPSLEVRVMAEAEGYAMVRRPHCAPFVTPLMYLWRIESERKEPKA